MGRKVATRVKRQKEFLDTDQPHNMVPKRKTWSVHDLKSIRAKTDAQTEMLEEWFSGNNICASGSAGTGKSFLAMYMGLAAMLDEESVIDRLIIVRSAVTTREVGFLPGTLEEKQSVYEQPYKDIASVLLGRDASYIDMKEAGKIEFMLTSHVRGLTWNDAVIIIDEAQNMTMHELSSVITRLGHNSRIIIIGDTKQTDLNRKGEHEGLSTAMSVMRDVKGISLITFTADDIVRSGFVRSWIRACEAQGV
jgi:phosphate starvation-inducible protein PhoH and related proteins